MAKIEIPIRVYMGEIEEIINELKHLQTYKLFEGDDEVLINRDDVIKIFANHLRTETLSGYTIEPERKKEKWIPCKERLPENTRTVLTTFIEDGVAKVDTLNYFAEPLGWTDFRYDEELCRPKSYEVIAWMPLPELWRREEDE